jgi:hypothetical protein
MVLFSAFIFFALFLFPKSDPKKVKPLPRDKRARNWIYIFCGVAMVICLLWAIRASFTGAPIFWPEALALEFFAVSWLVKGRADLTAGALGKRALYYGRNPGKLIGKVWSAIRG